MFIVTVLLGLDVAAHGQRELQNKTHISPTSIKEWKLNMYSLVPLGHDPLRLDSGRAATHLGEDKG